VSICSECGKHIHECASCPVIMRSMSWKVAKDLNSHPRKVERYNPTPQGTHRFKAYCPVCGQYQYALTDDGSLDIVFGEPYYCGNPACNALLDNGVE